MLVGAINISSRVVAAPQNHVFLLDMLIVDEISQVGSLTLVSVDSRLILYRDDAHRPFGGIPIVIFFGDFFQFDPVRQTSLRLPEPKDYSRQNPESLAKYMTVYKLFLRFTAGYER